MSDDSQRPIIVKRVKKSAHGHHGGAWKIAYADFVTAMMAFFLLMWLLGSTTKGDLAGIAEYFKTPLKVALGGGSGSGDSSSVIKGGGKDLTRAEGQVKKGSTPEQKKIVNIKAAQLDASRINPVQKKVVEGKAAQAEAERTSPDQKKVVDIKASQMAAERIEKEQLKSLKGKLEKMIDANPFLKQFKKQLLIDITSEGLRIQIVDEKKRPMFASGRAETQPYTKEILREIGKVLNEVPNRISLSGHTDATPYSSGEKGYSNWELSADRANSSRRELIAGGMADSKILRVVGLSSAVLFDKKDPFNPINRRISIIVMNKQTEAAISSDGGAFDTSAKDIVKGAQGAL